MTPETFLAEIAQPNTAAAIDGPNDTRAIVNAIMALDALVSVPSRQAFPIGR